MAGMRNPQGSNKLHRYRRPEGYNAFDRRLHFILEIESSFPLIDAEDYNEIIRLGAICIQDSEDAGYCDVAWPSKAGSCF